jgi:hypothetical protein
MANGKPRTLKPVSTLVQACLKEDLVVEGLLQSILFLEDYAEMFFEALISLMIPEAALPEAAPPKAKN